MAEETADKAAKESPVSVFRKKLVNKETLKATVLEGLKSTNAKVRTLAVKKAFQLKDHSVIKDNVLPLIKGDKSKKVLRTVSDKITRKELAAKVAKLKAAPKVAAKEGGDAAPEAPKA